ncbi:ABC transporter ATP-binding protein [Paramaledivibacter caminithermalis]|uniref:Putative ABC transport system ATP-binding protein n=1 Tax=Paramaledivibacter caminithermalis (strain DSM 15212 / CIP 107654 / DViRD3) TaxID=1121301 RepID=A0A1M6RL74_PARC5|nr:ABC transporter ATP-binding protein [Paramaledivibacter caminithermalis]SHK33097.1 putative ABC transport system ATP-binding protein [Paramaledivibacter caminithermalis DSM 15212]
MIEFKNINLRFDDKVVFENFSLKINKGEKILLNSPSGKGKSTLFKLLLGFEKLNSGEILFNGKRLNKNNLLYFRKNIGYVSQDVDVRKDRVWNLIEEIFSYKNNRHIKISKHYIIMNLQYFKLSEDILEKEVRQLSGGERQRLGLIICILLNREVWLLDEVTSGLDEDTKEIVVDYVLKQNKTILIISHDRIWCKNDVVRIEEW